MSQHKPVNNEHRFFLLLAFLISAGIGLVSFLAARASLYLDSQPVRLLPIGISGGLILAILLLSHRRAWPRIIFIVFDVVLFGEAPFRKEGGSFSKFSYGCLNVAYSPRNDGQKLSSLHLLGIGKHPLFISRHAKNAHS